MNADTRRYAPPARQSVPIHVTSTAADHRVAWLAALAIGIHVVESAVPSPVPGVKPGLANIVTVMVLIQFGWRTAAWVAGLRVLVGSLLLGTFLSPTFMLSAAGALASLTVLGLARRLPGTGFGPVGFSLLAALAHTGAQFLTAYGLFIPQPGLLWLLPVLMTAAVIFGVGNGIIAARLLPRIQPPGH
jgi:heptaprenyl diphosphate synthase